MDRIQANKAIKNGIIAACISGALTFIVFILALTSNLTGPLAAWGDPTIIVDLAIILSCTYGLYRNSVFAAILLIVYFVASKILTSIEAPSLALKGLPLSCVLIYYFAKAAQGTIALRQLEILENPNYRSPSKWWLLLKIPTAVFLILAIGYGALSSLAIFPATKVLSGAQIRQKDKETLLAQNVIAPGETIEYFYSYGLTSIMDGGAILTPDKLIAYLTDEDGKLMIFPIPYASITEVTLIEKGSALNESIYRVNTSDANTWAMLSLSTENNGDKQFISALEAKIAQATSAPRTE